MQAIILAGGKGSRLKPFTTNIPKPLMPIDDLPILEVVLRQLKYYGFTEIVITVNHLADLIMAFFGDGKKLGLKITYSMEDTPLGTAGPLALVENLQDNFIIMNGDLLTTINFKDFMSWHLKNNNDVTIAAYKKEVKIDLGVLKIEDGKFLDYIEKPVYNFDVSMGIYAFSKKMVSYIEKGKRLDMPDLMLLLKKEKKNIKCYQGDYYWLDIGRIDDYDQAVELFKAKRSEMLP